MQDEARASAKAQFDALTSNAPQQANAEVATETQASVEIEATPEETAQETRTEEAVKSEPEDKTKKLYKALGKKDKKIEELEAELSKLRESQKEYDPDNLSMIENVARKIVLEREIARNGDEERSKFEKESSLDGETFAAVEEIRKAHPTLPWEAAHKLYLSYSDTPKDSPKPTKNVLVGSAAPAAASAAPSIEDMREAAKKEFNAMFGL